MIDYPAILIAHYPGSEWTLDGDDYSGLTWLSDSPKPSEAELDALWPQVMAAKEIAAVQAARRARYEAETDPMAFRLLRQEPGVTVADYTAAVEAIRADLPYPS